MGLPTGSRGCIRMTDVGLVLFFTGVVICVVILFLVALVPDGRHVGAPSLVGRSSRM